MHCRLKCDLNLTSQVAICYLSDMIRLLWTIALFFLAACGPSLAQNPSRPKSKPCVLLKNQNVIFGKTTQLGNQVIVSRDDGTEIRLNVEQVWCWADSVQQLHEFRQANRTPGNIRIHLDDIRWCLRYGLLDQAGKELQLAYRIDPTNSQAIALEEQLLRERKAIRRFDEPSELIAKPINANSAPPAANSLSKVDLVSYVASSEPESELSPTAISHFGSRVQPILLNRCAGCHRSENPNTKWSLIRPTFGSRASPRITRLNALSTVGQVNKTTPEESALYKRAIDSHGGAHRSIREKDVAIRRSILEWLTIVGSNQNPAQKVAPANDLAPIQIPDDAAQPISAVKETKPERSGGRLPAVQNPFDPEIFNRRYHSDQ